MILAVCILMQAAGYAMSAGNSFFITRAYYAPEDTATNPKPRFPVRRTTTETTEDVKHRSSDLKDPANLKTEVTYDEKDGTYSVGTVMAPTDDKDGKKSRGTSSTSTRPSSSQSAKNFNSANKNATNVKMGSFLPANPQGLTLGTATSYLTAPILMTPEEYQKWSLKQSMAQYYRHRNQELFVNNGNNKFDFTDMHFSLGAAEKIFGPGGVQIKTQGSAELKMGANLKFVDNPALASNRRSTFGFDFDTKINVSMTGKVGDKVNMNLNYNTDATFDADAQNMKLKYDGKEDEIIKLVEAGNVSLPSNMSLVPGVSSLFGIRTDLQFGKLKLQTVVSQKKSATTSVSGKGGSSTQSFEFPATDYEENRHFFLGHYFRTQYDKNMRTLPTIASGITIKRVEIWVTNKTGSTTNNRNILALADLGESKYSYRWDPSSINNITENSANSEYSTLAAIPELRDISQVSNILESAPYNMIVGTEYEKLQGARLLSSSEYTLNTALGTVSLNSTLQTDDVLAIAFEYSYNGVIHQVGEFSTDVPSTGNTLLVKLLKGTANTPRVSLPDCSNIQLPVWKLMMRNVYYLGASTTTKDRFRFDVKWQNDSSGVYITYLPDEKLKGTTLLKAMGLDRLDANNKPHSNGQFDYVEGYTIAKGRVIFPVAEPFGSNLEEWIKATDPTADPSKYVFKELYDSTKTAARQMAEKNKFLMTGQYKGSAAGEIDLGVTNIAQGSVVVTAGGVTLTENSDYTVDYNMGRVTIINQSILDAGTNVSASVESNDTYGLQRKTFLGLNLDYEYSKNLVFGGTFQYLSETPLTTKVAMGSEPLKNLLWGAHLSWKHKAQWLTNLIDKIPFIHATQPSQINFDGEIAQLVAGQNTSTQGKASYLDDFEDTKKKTSLIQPTYWQLSSTPSMFAESALMNDKQYGFNRALMSWYCVDPMFTLRSSSFLPGYMRADPSYVSNHYVREVYERELYPQRYQVSSYTTASTLPVMNMAFYPTERGPYNLTLDVDQNGRLLNPKSRWGGMMRKMDNPDFEAQNIEYIEFWMLDPFIYQRRDGTLPTFQGGDLYMNLGELSEDILKDGKKAYESGMPFNGDPSYYTECYWGRIPNTSSVTYAFNNETGSRKYQDVGLNGLSSEEEANFGLYSEFLTDIEGKVNAEAYTRLQRDPASDNYHYYRGTDYDNMKLGVLDRYRYVNNPEGNSPDSETNPESYETAWKTTPDLEDINTDYTLNENEKYFGYRVSIRPQDFVVGENYIQDKRTAIVGLRDGTRDTVDWYLFRVPIKEYDPSLKVGSISDFSSIRFMRMFMTNFQDSVVLRFGSLDLVHGDWRTYEQPLDNKGVANDGSFVVTAVSIEENNDKTPVNYILPPGISRIDDTQSETVEVNEQALAFTSKNLSPGNSRAVYKNCKYDMRKYKHLQLFTHANALAGDEVNLHDGEVSVFLRLGSDYKSNYYEYEVPLRITAPKHYDNNSPTDRILVWPEENMLNFNLTKLTDLKKQRNKFRSMHMASYNQLYSDYDSDHPTNRISIMGNPTLGEVKTIMIGIRNNGREIKNIEVWVNELRLQEFTNEGGWAAQGTLNIQLSDIGSFNATGKIVTAGFGGVEQSVQDRTDEDSYQYNFTTNVNAGRLFPEKAKINLPIYYSYGKQIVKPKYNPLDSDMLLSEALDALQTQEEKDSLTALTTKRTVTENFSISGAKINIATKKHPMPYDPANFTVSYSSSSTTRNGETTVYEYDRSWKANINYSWNPNWKSWEPFKQMKTKNKWAQIIKDQNLSFAPQSITFNTDLSHTYYELQERDMENLDHPQSLPVNFSSSYLWNRSFNMRWDIFKALHFTFQSSTHAEVEQPNRVINKDLYPDDYQAWKDSVKMSLLHFGRPLDYNQNMQISYKFPINKLPALDWVTADGSYNSTYTWRRGTELADGSTLGNTINTQRVYNINGKLAMETLYNHSDFLKEANKRFSASSAKSAANKKKEAKKKEDAQKRQEREEQKKALAAAEEESKKTGVPVDSILAINNAAQGNAKGQTTQKQTDTKKQNKGFVQEIVLLPDTQMTITHNQKSKKLRVVAMDKKGKEYDLKFKKVDENKIQLLTTARDTSRIRLNIVAKPKPEEQKWYTWAQAGSRFLMMLRNVSVSYKNTFNLNLPGFLPEVGDMLGQRDLGDGHGFAPGVDFGMGFVGESYIDRARRNGWLLCSDSLSTPATTTTTTDLQIKASLEPFTDVKIDLNMSRTMNRSKSIQYMYQGSPTTVTGSFNMTTISLATAFQSRGNAANGYYSEAFNKLRENIGIIQNRLQNKYIGTIDPSGQRYIGPNGTGEGNKTPVNPYGADVMIPAFLSAYCGGSAHTGSLDIFPSLLRMLPNWNLTYKGLGNLPWIRDHFKSVTISHGYKSIYAVGSYNSFSSFMQLMGGGHDMEDMGYVQSTGGGWTPSSMYDIGTVSLNESFAPLVGLNMTFQNNMTLKMEYRTTRVVTLSMTAAQVNETGSKDFVIGWGYKINDFKLSSLFGNPASKRAARNNRSKGSKAKNNSDDANASNSSSTANRSTSKKNFAHDLNLRFDFSIRNQDAIRRDIQTGLSEATSGNKAVKASFQLDYTMSRYVTFTMYYDRQRNAPLLSTSSYPTTTQDFGFSMKFNLTR